MLFGIKLYYTKWYKVNAFILATYSYVAKQIGDALRDARERAGISQSALARMTGIAPNIVSRIEAGERPNPQFATVARLARALGISLDGLAADCGLMPRSDSNSRPSANLAAIADLHSVGKQLEQLQSRVVDAVQKLGGTPSKKRIRR
jgi:transcriptional regulator with XRE-family HTH domain